VGDTATSVELTGLEVPGTEVFAAVNESSANWNSSNFLTLPARSDKLPLMD
jgi:hypothetical protein